ncbi:MAG: hypothetical protein ACXAC7_05020 [Candidatus Hodarchaeales archaeon]|jgi:hypothetical protein
MKTINQLNFMFDLGYRFGELFWYFEQAYHERDIENPEIDIRKVSRSNRQKMKVSLVVNKLTDILIALEEMDITLEIRNEIKEYLDDLTVKYGELKEVEETEDAYLFSKIKTKIKTKYNTNKYQRSKFNLADTKELGLKLNGWKKGLQLIIGDIDLIIPHSDFNISREKLKKGPQAFIGECWDELSTFEKQNLSDCVNCLLIGTWTPVIVISTQLIEYEIRKFVVNEKIRNLPFEEILNHLKEDENIDRVLLMDLISLNELKMNLQTSSIIFDIVEAEKTFLTAIKVVKYFYNNK